LNIYYKKIITFSPFMISLFMAPLKVSAFNCNNVISSNFIDEDIAISDTQKISISPWPIFQFDTNCKTQGQWNIASSIAYQEDGDDDIKNITNLHISQASISISKGDYKVEAGRYLNNFSYNSVFGIALPMKTIPAIQLDEASYLQTVAPDVILVRVNIKTGFGDTYITGYRADKTFEHKNNVDGSYNMGIAKSLGGHTNIEFQYANESTEDSDTDEQRASLFVNTSGAMYDKINWVIGAEINTFKNRNYNKGNNDTTANLYSEISKKNLFLQNIDAYISAGGAHDEENLSIVEIGGFLNISGLFHLHKNLSLLAGGAQSYTRFSSGDNITTSRYSIQLRYKL